MFCNKCGNKVEVSDKFCDKCGANLQEISNQNVSKTSNIACDCKRILKKFFSKNPASSIEETKNVKSNIGVFFIVLAIVLFSFVSCLNITQCINRGLNSINDVINSTATNILGGLGNQVSVYLPNLEISFLIELFIPYLIFAIVVTGIVYGGIYFTLKVRKLPSSDIACTLNMLGTSSLPIIIALILNVLLGFVFPQATPFIFVIGVFVSAIFVYETIATLTNNEHKPIIEIAIIVLVVLLVGIIILNITMGQITVELKNLLMSKADEVLKGGTDLISNFLGSIF